MAKEKISVTVDAALLAEADADNVEMQERLTGIAGVL